MWSIVLGSVLRSGGRSLSLMLTWTLLLYFLPLLSSVNAGMMSDSELGLWIYRSSVLLSGSPGELLIRLTHLSLAFTKRMEYCLRSRTLPEIKSLSSIFLS